MRPLALLLLFALACNPGAYGEAPVSTCAEAGVQCQLADGPRGVCQPTPCEAGQPAPCLICMPQH